MAPRRASRRHRGKPRRGQHESAAAVHQRPHRRRLLSCPAEGGRGLLTLVVFGDGSIELRAHSTLTKTQTQHKAQGGLRARPRRRSEAGLRRTSPRVSARRCCAVTSTTRARCSPRCAAGAAEYSDERLIIELPIRRQRRARAARARSAQWLGERVSPRHVRRPPERGPQPPDGLVRRSHRQAAPPPQTNAWLAGCVQLP